MKKFIEIEDDVFDAIYKRAKENGFVSVDEYLDAIASGRMTVSMEESPSVKKAI